MRVMVIALIILCSGIVQAQDTPPPGYLDSCNSQPVLYDFFGPNCLNPVTWDLPGMYLIDTWVFFLMDDGTTDAGQIKGYMWQPIERRYEYWVLTEMPFGNYGGRLDVVSNEQIIQVVQ